MQPIEFPEQNDMLGHGNIPGVVNLPIYRDGSEVISCWAVSPEELVEIIATGRVYLRVKMPSSHPPVIVEGTYPFVKREH